MLKILIVGGGGREHALAWKLAQNGHELWCAPGNAGICRLARCVDVDPLDTAKILSLVRDQSIDLTVIGPEDPLAAGLADVLRAEQRCTFGPGAAGARIESDKAWAKRLMLESGIPTARFAVFDDIDRARGYVSAHPLPVVVKVAGLAAGKGVLVCQTRDEAELALILAMKDRRFGDAGRAVVIEEFLEGEEASVLAFCDGRTIRCLPSSQDHKRLLDGDAGPNTGGMGAYAPAPVVTATVEDQVRRLVLDPLLSALRERDIDYRGMVYVGLVLTSSGPRVLEFNCRFGDPETQVVLPLLANDLADIAMACAEGCLDAACLDILPRSALCVVMAATGYPGTYRKGIALEGDLDGGGDTIVFHAGTRKEDGRVVSSGGRVLAVTGIGDTLAEARDRAYDAVRRIRFDGSFYRRDIGVRGLQRSSG